MYSEFVELCDIYETQIMSLENEIDDLKVEVLHWQRVNEFVRKNTLQTLINRLEWLRRELDERGAPTNGVVQSMEMAISMMKEG